MIGSATAGRRWDVPKTLLAAHLGCVLLVGASLRCRPACARTKDSHAARPTRRKTARPSAPKYPKPDYVATLVGKTFLRAVAERDTETAMPLCASTVQFDGQRITGHAAVTRRLKQMIARVRAGMRFKQVLCLTYKEAVARFGPPPRRLSGVKWKNSVVVLGRLHTGGVVVVLNKIGERYRVVAITD